MSKEIKYLSFTIIIITFFFLIGKHYFSDSNKKKSFRSFNNINNKIDIYAKKLPVIASDTMNIIEYVEQTNSKKKKYNFWKLLDSNE
jgi:predicted nucleic acid-binding OB-fold protein